MAKRKQNLTDEVRYVYIMVAQTATIPARLIQFYTRKPYAHTSIALDRDLTQMYSFARKGVYNPFNSGFVQENIETGIFGKHKQTRCCVYALPITANQYEAVEKEIGRFKANSSIYRYNYLGLVGAMFYRPVIRDTRYFCSQFVAYILQNAGVDLFHRSNGLVRPYDFFQRLRKYRIYEGPLNEYRNYLLQQERVHIDHKFIATI